MRERVMLPSRIEAIEIEVSLEHIEPRIWRRLIVPARISLALLHDVLQTSFGWKNYHLHMFHTGDVRFGIPHPEDEFLMVDERFAPIGAFVRAPLLYEYDFGDGWSHEIVTLRNARDAQDTLTCTGRERACPPEDCGGPAGYEELLSILANPEHEEHASMKKWVGKRFDPNQFDREAVNKRLSKLAKRVPRI